MREMEIKMKKIVIDTTQDVVYEAIKMAYPHVDIVFHTERSNHYVDCDIDIDVELVKKNIGQAEFKIINSIKEKNAKVKRDKRLKKGTISKDGKMWFNKETFLEFATEYATLEDDELLVWRDANRQRIELTKTQAKVYILEGKALIKNLYGL